MLEHLFSFTNYFHMKKHAKFDEKGNMKLQNYTLPKTAFTKAILTKIFIASPDDL